MLEYATRALAEIASLKAVAADLNQDNRGTLSIATTHTQARYVLPPVVQAFRERYPDVELHLHQGTSEQIAEMVATDRVQLAIATGSDALFPGLVLLPGLSLAPPGDRAQDATRWPATRKLTPAGTGEVSAGHLRIQLLGRLIAPERVLPRGPEARRWR